MRIGVASRLVYKMFYRSSTINSVGRLRFVHAVTRVLCVGRKSQRLVPLKIRASQRYLTPAKNEVEKERNESNEEAKSWRENPNLKYWILGTLGVSSSVYYYVRRNREKSRRIIKSFPSLPSHYIQPREKDLTALTALHDQLKRTGSVTVLQIVGDVGSGKTQLARAFADRLAKVDEKSYHLFPGDLHYGTFNGSSIESLLFDVKRFAVSIGCLESDWKSKMTEGLQYTSLSQEKQLDCLVEAVIEKLQDSQAWILILENVKDGEVFRRWFSNDSQRKWGNGTILVTRHNDIRNDNLVNSTSNIVNISNGMDVEDGVELLSKLSGLKGDKLMAAEDVVKLLEGSPLALVSAGYYIGTKARRNSSYSCLHFLDDLNYESQKANHVVELPPLLGVVAMATKSLVEESPHLLHVFDFLGSCSPDWPIPITLIALYLRSPDFNLPPVIGGGSVLPSQTHVGTRTDDNVGGEEVDEMFFSIKKLAKNLESFMSAVKDNVEAIKAMLNPEMPDMPQIPDGVVEMLKACPLVSVQKMEDVGVETVVVSPVMYTVFQQLFQCLIMHKLEAQYLQKAEEKHNTSSWLRRLWRFDPQRTLQEYRNSLGEVSQVEMFTNHYLNVSRHEDERREEISQHLALLDVRGVLKDELELKEEFRKIKSQDEVRHCQQHVARILKTFNEVASVCGQDNQTRTLVRLIKPHLDHILGSRTSRTLGPKSHAHAISAMAAIDSSLGKLDSSKMLLEEVLKIETDLYGESSLEVASTLTRLADVFSSLDDLPKCRELLERSLQIYESQRRKFGEYKQPLSYARTLSSLGATYGSLGFKERSRDYIERAFSFLQSGAPINPNEVETRRFMNDVASTLTDLGHAYLSLGETTTARRYLDMALNGHKNIYGDEHPEVVRTLTVLGIAYTMQGNWPEAKKVRKEAAKLQAKLDAKPFI